MCVYICVCMALYVCVSNGYSLKSDAPKQSQLFWYPLVLVFSFALHSVLFSPDFRSHFLNV